MVFLHANIMQALRKWVFPLFLHSLFYLILGIEGSCNFYVSGLYLTIVNVKLVGDLMLLSAFL